MKKLITQTIPLLLILSVIQPEIALANSAPVLSSDYHSPSWGYPGMNFTFSITYSDEDGDPPTYVRVYIQPPNTPYTEDMGNDMSHESGSYQEGALYTLKWAATSEYIGNLNHYFEASDGLERINKPSYGGSCTPGDCPTCCGDLGGPAIFSSPIDNCGIYLFSKESETPLWSYETNSDWIDKVVISADGSHIAAKTYNGIVYLFSKDSNTPLWTHNESCEGLGSVAISSNGSYIAAGSGYSLHLFTTKNSTPLWSYTAGSTISSISISADGDYIAAGSYNNRLYLFSKENSTPLWVYEVLSTGGEGGGADVTAASISADGNYIAAGTGCPDRSLYLFSRDSNTPLWTRKISTNSPVESISMSADGSFFVIGDGGPDDPTGLYLFSKENNNSLWSYVTNGSVNSVSASSDGSRLVAQNDMHLHLFSGDNNLSIWSYTGDSTVTSVSISKDSGYIIAGDISKKIHLFSNSSNVSFWSHQVDEWVMSTDISANGSYIVAGSGASIYLGLENPGEMNYDNITCGDGICEGNETYENCPEDCIGSGCELPGDYPPCGEVSLSEVVDYINLWFEGQDLLVEVIDLINVWASGTEELQLTTSQERDADPSWCSNDKIVYWSEKTGGGDIYIVDSDGTNEKRLTNSSLKEMDPACSPDGLKIVYTLEQTENITLWIVNADGSGNEQLTDEMGMWPAWSPSGDKIVYSSNDDIWIMNWNGSNRTRLTSSPEKEYSPCFNPDGSRVIYSVGEEGSGGTVPTKGTANLWIMDSDGSNQTLIFSSDGEQVCFQEGWGPEEIVYMDTNAPQPTVWVMNEDGSDKEQLIGDPDHSNGDPAFSPDGTRLAWMSNRIGNDDIWIKEV